MATLSDVHMVETPPPGTKICEDSNPNGSCLWFSKDLAEGKVDCYRASKNLMRVSEQADAACSAAAAEVFVHSTAAAGMAKWRRARGVRCAVLHEAKVYMGAIRAFNEDESSCTIELEDLHRPGFWLRPFAHVKNNNVWPVNQVLGSRVDQQPISGRCLEKTRPKLPKRSHMVFQMDPRGPDVWNRDPMEVAKGPDAKRSKASRKAKQKARSRKTFRGDTFPTGTSSQLRPSSLEFVKLLEDLHPDVEIADENLPYKDKTE